MKDIRIETKRFLLRSLLKDDVSASYLSWINGSGSSAYIEYAGQDRTLEELRIYVLQKSGEKSALFLGIFTLDTLQHIGNIKYEPVDFHNKTAMMGILVGEESWRGRGVAQEVIDQGFRIMGTDPLNVVVKIDLRPEMGDWVNDAQSVRERVRVRLRDQHGSIKYLDYQYKRDNMAVFTTQMEGRSFNGWLEVSSGKWWEQTEFRVTAELSNDVTKAIENRIKTGQNFQIEAAVPALGSIQGEDEIEVEKGNSVKLLVKIPFTPEEGLTESDMSLVLYTDLFSADERWDIVEPSQLTGFKRVDTEDGSIAWEVEFIPQRNGRLTFYVTMRNAPQKQIWHSDHEGDDIVIQLVEPEAGSANEQSV